MPPPLRALFPHCLERESIWKDSSRCMLHGEIGVIDAAEQVWHALIPWCLLTSVHSQARLGNLLSCTAPVCNLRVTSAAGRTASSKANAKWKVKSNPGLQKKENSFSFRAEAPVWSSSWHPARSETLYASTRSSLVPLYSPPLCPEPTALAGASETQVSS